MGIVWTVLLLIAFICWVLIMICNYLDFKENGFKRGGGGSISPY